MNPRRRGAPALLILSLALVAAPIPVGAAEAPRPVVAGDRVRVSFLEAPPVTGILLAHRIDTLEIALAPDSTRRIARDQVAGFEVARRHGQAGKGALVGLLVAVSGGAVVLATVDVERMTGAGMGALVASGVLAVVLGTLIGASIEKERWESAPMP